MDEFYSKASVGARIQDVKNLASQETSRFERILQEQEKALRESQQKTEVYRKVGDAVYLHLNDLQILLQRIMREKREGKDWKQISETLEKEKSEARTSAVFFEALNPDTLTVQVSVEGQSFQLGP